MEHYLVLVKKQKIHDYNGPITSQINHTLYSNQQILWFNNHLVNFRQTYLNALECFDKDENTHNRYILKVNKDL